MPKKKIIKTAKPLAKGKAMRSGGTKKRSEPPFGQRRLAGLVFLVFILLIVSVLTGLTLKPDFVVFVSGEIASQDVTAAHDLLLEDSEATRIKRERVGASQPPVFDLDLLAATRLETRLSQFLTMLNSENNDDMEVLRREFEELYDSEISRQTFDIWRNNEIQNLLFIRLLPWLQGRLRDGVIDDGVLLSQYRQGIIVRENIDQNETLRTDLGSLADVSRVLYELRELLAEEYDKPLRTRKAIVTLFGLLMRPSLELNQSATNARRDEVMAGVEPVYRQIKAGEVVVRQGERVDETAQVTLQALFSKQSEYFQVFRPIGVFVIGLCLVLGLMLTPSGTTLKPLSNRDSILIGLCILLLVGVSRLLGVIEAPLAEAFPYLAGGIPPYALPVAGMAGVLALFFPALVCLFAALLLSFLCMETVSGSLGLFLFYFLGSVANTMLIKKTQTRPEMLKSIFPLTGCLVIIWFGVGFLDFHGLTDMGVEVLFVIANGFMSLLLLLSISPIVEMIFGYTSRFRLLELMNLEQPLLQEVMVAVPGTYHHSLIVANMAEAGARAIGANALLCKVSALYHDVGKLKSPEYFIENQLGKKNRHDKLAPSMSALILISHVKKGVELAREYKLGQEITDIIEQHHGTSLIRFFHNRAVEQAEAKGGEPVLEEDYRYPGPKPQTKEAGLVLLADVIEASSRALHDPTVSRVKGHIQTMMRSIFEQGQLDETDLTMKDLHLLGGAFNRILSGIFHQRVEYPGGQKDQAKQILLGQDKNRRQGGASPSGTGSGEVEERYGPDVGKSKEPLQ